MYSIGEFSRITGLSIKALRFYHGKQLLVPSTVDRETKYRYYNHKSIEKARMIKILKSLDFKISDIQQILESGEDLEEFIKQHRQRIQQEISRYEAIAKRLDALLENKKHLESVLRDKMSPMRELQIPEIYVAYKKYCGNYFDSVEMLTNMAQNILPNNRQRPINLFYDMEYSENEANVECCIPIIDPQAIAQQVEIRKLPSQKVLSCVYHGPYEDFEHIYEEMILYIKLNNKTSELFCRSVRFI